MATKAIEFQKRHFITGGATELYNQRLSKDFELHEFHCPCSHSGCSITLVDAALVDLLQALRDAMEVPIHVTSGYRCISRNAEVGGAKASQHLYGLAADIKTDNRKLLKNAIPILRALPRIGGLGHYYKDGAIWRLHVDVRPRDAKLGLIEWRKDL